MKIRNVLVLSILLALPSLPLSAALITYEANWISTNGTNTATSTLTLDDSLLDGVTDHSIGAIEDATFSGTLDSGATFDFGYTDIDYAIHWELDSNGASLLFRDLLYDFLNDNYFVTVDVLNNSALFSGSDSTEFVLANNGAFSLQSVPSSGGEVPEPAIIALLTLGLINLGFVRRRQIIKS